MVLSTCRLCLEKTEIVKRGVCSSCASRQDRTLRLLGERDLLSDPQGSSQIFPREDANE